MNESAPITLFRKASISLAFMVCMSIGLCACKSEPENLVVVSKNDGEFSEIIQDTSYEQNDFTMNESTHIAISDSFFSTDESVEFTFNINQTIANKAMPVVEVVPHYLTAEDAQRVASCLFGEIDFFEADPLLSPCYTKEEIQT